jgi:integrase
MVLARLRTVFKTAQRRKDGAGDPLLVNDPMKYVNNLREPKTDVDPFTREEVNRVLQACNGWEKTFVTILFATGVRPNEALALYWGDIDFNCGIIRVRATLHRNRFGGRELPKTPGSERDISMSDIARRALEEQRARSEARGALVFPNDDGSPMDLSNFRRRNWEGILKGTKPRVTTRPIYQCRHSAATLALDAGATPREVADMLGHTSVEMVFRRYAKWIRGLNNGGAAKALDRALSPSSHESSMGST